MFVHLRLHTEFSVVDGTCRIDETVAAAAADGQVALTISDFNNVFGALKFYKSCRAKGIKPLIAAELAMQPLSLPNAPSDTPCRILVIAQNVQGWHNLCEILARAWTQGNTVRGQTQPLIAWSWLQELGAGLIVLCGAAAGPVGQTLARGDEAAAAARALHLAQLFPHRFYLEIQRAGRTGEEALLAQTVKLAARLAVPVVATHPVQFPDADGFDAHEARVCIAEGEVLANQRRVRRFTREQYFKTRAQMQALFSDVPSAIENTLEIARRCSLELTLGKSFLPAFPTPDAMPVAEYFRQVSFEGLQKRLVQLYPNEAERERKRPTYVERLEFELAIIVKMDFPGYFLIVADFISWAKNNGCPVGPGRGSGAGSLVAYVLGITDLDPLAYNLLFERFLNPERVSMPDFDVDFCQANRDRVIDYVKRRYGRAAVSQIATFGTMAARAAIRDVGRVMDMSYNFCDGISKLIPNKPGKPVTIQYPPENLSDAEREKYAIAAEPMLAERIEREEEVKNLIEMAQQLEGLTRNIGMHAGGVVIAPGKLTDFCPLYQQPGSDAAVAMFDKDDVEAIGLVKFDFLGLATLTILENARQLIIQRHKGQENFRFEDVPLDDEATFALFQRGQTEAVFQFESRGMQAMLKEALPSRLEDLIALNALYRPGPMDLIPSFVARKHGREEIIYPHPMVEKVLAETYGIMVYQEQVMQTAQILGGYSLGGADLLRRAMGKKKPEEMAQHRLIFREGAAKNGISAEQADEVFDLMEKFAGYGFNKSHAAAYSLLAYHTGWLKVHYTAEFFCANMTVEMDNTDKLKVLYEDACAMGIAFEGPDINRGHYRFTPVTNQLIRYGLGAIKGTGESAINAMLAAREAGGPFKDIFDFCCRVDRTKFNKRTLDALIKAGAFDSVNPDRAALSASVDLAIEFATTQAANASQGGLFDLMGDDAQGASGQHPPLVATLPWGLRERLAHEKTAIGFYLSGHLFDEIAHEVAHIAPRPIAQLRDAREPQTVAGIVSDFRIVSAARGKLCLFQLEDKTGAIAVSVDEAQWLAHKDWLRDDAPAIVHGRVQADHFGGGGALRLKGNALSSLEAARVRSARHVLIDARTGALPDIAQFLRDHPARVQQQPEGEDSNTQRTGLKLRVLLRCNTPQDAADAADLPHAFTVELELDPQHQCWPSNEALAALHAATGSPAQIIWDTKNV